MLVTPTLSKCSMFKPQKPREKKGPPEKVACGNPPAADPPLPPHLVHLLDVRFKAVDDRLLDWGTPNPQETTKALFFAISPMLHTQGQALSKQIEAEAQDWMFVVHCNLRVGVARLSTTGDLISRIH